MAQEPNPFDDLDGNPFDDLDESAQHKSTNFLATQRFADEPPENFVGPLTPGQEQAKEGGDNLRIQNAALAGVGENIVGAITALPAMAAGGAWGALRGLFSWNKDKAVDAINTVENWSFQPKTDAGKFVAEEIMAKPEKAVDGYLSYLQELHKGTARAPVYDIASGPIADLVGGSPLLLAGIKTSILGAADMIGLRKMRIEANTRNAAIEEVKAKARALNLDLDKRKLREQFRDIGEKATIIGKEGYQSVADTLRYESEVAQMRTDTVYEAFLGTESAIKPKPLITLTKDVKAEMLDRNLILGKMPEVNNLLDLIEGLGRGEETVIKDAYVKIGYGESDSVASNANPNAVPPIKVGDHIPGSIQMVNNPRIKALDAVVQMVNEATNRAKALPGGATQQDLVLQGILKPKLEQMVENQYLQDMMVGDPQALQLWNDSKNLHQYFKETFHEDRAIATLISKEVTPSQIKSLIFGESTLSSKIASETIVPKIIKILGEDSPQVAGLRLEFNYDVVKPLLQEHPDLKGFMLNYERVVEKRPGLVKSLNPFGATKLDDAYAFAKAIDTTGGDPTAMLSFNRITAQALFGHQIAKAAMRRSLAEAGIAYLRGTGEREQRAIIRQMLNYDPYKPMIPKGSLGFNTFTLDYYNNIFNPDKAQDERPPQ